MFLHSYLKYKFCSNSWSFQSDKDKNNGALKIEWLLNRQYSVILVLMMVVFYAKKAVEDKSKSFVMICIFAEEVGKRFLLLPRFFLCQVRDDSTDSQWQARPKVCVFRKPHGKTKPQKRDLISSFVISKCRVIHESKIDCLPRDQWRALGKIIGNPRRCYLRYLETLLSFFSHLLWGTICDEVSRKGTQLKNDGFVERGRREKWRSGLSHLRGYETQFPPCFDRENWA